MISIVQHCSRASSLFSTIISYFYTASHATSRLILIRCVGEAIARWNLEVVNSKRNEIISLVLNGLRDRAGEVRESARIVFCLLYCRTLPSLPSLHELNELDNTQGMLLKLKLNLVMMMKMIG